MKINKKLTALMMTLAMGVSLVACGPKNTVPETPETEIVTPEENVDEETPEVSKLESVVTDLSEGTELPAQVPMNAEMFADAYGIDTSLLKDYYVGISMMNVHATEIALFELNDVKDAQTVIQGIEKRQKGLEDQWSSYLPDQLELVQNYKTVQKENMILFVISEEADKIVENFNNLVQK